PPPPRVSTLLPYTTLFRSPDGHAELAPRRLEHRVRRAHGEILLRRSEVGGEYGGGAVHGECDVGRRAGDDELVGQLQEDECGLEDRKSTRLNSSHEWISYA